MATRQLSKLVPAMIAAASRSTSCLAAASMALQAGPATKLVEVGLGFSARSFHSSSLAADAVAGAAGKAPVSYEPARKYRALVDKELWHEAWMYEDKFGTETDPIVVPSLEKERIIGVTDPEDDNLVVWGVLRDGEPARQFIEGGEYYVLKKVPYVTKVGDVLEQIEAAKAAALDK